MTAEGVLVWINLGLLVLGLIGGWLYLARRFGALEENFRQGLRSIAAYMESHGRLLGPWPKRKSFPLRRFIGSRSPCWRPPVIRSVASSTASGRGRATR